MLTQAQVALTGGLPEASSLSFKADAQIGCKAVRRSWHSKQATQSDETMALRVQPVHRHFTFCVECPWTPDNRWLPLCLSTSQNTVVPIYE